MSSLSRTVGIVLNLKDKVSNTLLNISKRFTKNEKDAKKLAGTIQHLSKKWALIGTAGVGAYVAIRKVIDDNIKKVTEFGDRIDKHSKQIGMSTKAYQQWDFIMSQNGGSVDNLSSAYKTLRSHLIGVQKGSKDSIGQFKKLGVAVKDNNGNLRSQDDIFEDCVKSLQKMTNETERALLGQQIFGKGFQELAPLLDSGANSIEKLKKEYADLGLGISDKDIQSAVALTDTMDKLHRAFELIGLQLGIALMPAIQELNDRIIESMPTIKAVAIPVLKGLGKLLGWLAKNCDVLVPAIVAVSGAFMGLNLATKIFNVTMWAFMTTNPFGWVLGAIALIATLTAGVITLVRHFKRLHKEKDNVKEKDVEEIEEQTKVKPQKHALGTSYFSGGLTSVNENGGEIIDLPRGSRIIPADKSDKMMNSSNVFNINLSIEGNVIGNRQFLEQVGDYLVGEIRKVVPA